MSSVLLETEGALIVFITIRILCLYMYTFHHKRKKQPPQTNSTFDHNNAAAGKYHVELNHVHVHVG